jgi:hypothetical protein
VNLESSTPEFCYFFFYITYYTWSPAVRVCISWGSFLFFIFFYILLRTESLDTQRIVTIAYWSGFFRETGENLQIVIRDLLLELAHVVKEAKVPHNLLFARWRTKDAGGVIQS